MTYMIIEKFHPGKVRELYARLRTHGRQLPGGVVYVHSWIDEKMETCYQLMESDTPEKIQEWVKCWQDVADFTIIPVISSAEAQQRVDAL